jgi:hypothetical protein
MNLQELATVLAALRHFQRNTLEDYRAKNYPEHFSDIEPLKDAEIDELCERLNTEATTEPPKVLIYMEGGLIHDVSVSEEMEVLILDHDTEGMEDDDEEATESVKTIRHFPGEPLREEEFYVMDKGLIEATPEWVDHYFKEARKENG